MAGIILFSVSGCEWFLKSPVCPNTPDWERRQRLFAVLRGPGSWFSSLCPISSVRLHVRRCRKHEQVTSCPCGITAVAAAYHPDQGASNGCISRVV